MVSPLLSQRKILGASMQTSEKNSYIKTNKCTNFSNLFLE